MISELIGCDMTDLKTAVEEINKNNFKKAFNILLPLSNDGNASAQFYIGSLYFLGLGVFENEREAKNLHSSAIKTFKEQAENGHKEAISRLGRILASGEQISDTDFLEELKWLKLASCYGCREASFMLGNIYNTGYRVNDINENDFFPIINKREVFKWFKISAEQGMGFGMINVASFLKHGIGTICHTCF